MIPLYELLQNIFELSSAWTWVLMAVACLIPCLIVFLVIQGVAGGSTYIERKVAADIQRRVGPNQCNPGNFLGVFVRDSIKRSKDPKTNALGRLMGTLLQPAVPLIDFLDKFLGRWAPGLLIFLADGIKLILKECIVPAKADKPLFMLAPVIVLASAFGALAVVPYSSGFFIADYNVGIFYLAAITSLEAIGILMAGWASNNKWALLGGMRSAAQIVSYEIPAGLSILCVIVLAGGMSVQGIIYSQIGPTFAHWSQGYWWHWYIFSSPFMFVLGPAYFLAALAECNRTPFDIPEAESELVAGYHTEYTGMSFAFFFMAEYAMMCVLSALGVAIFLGGWSTGIGFIERAMMQHNVGETVGGTVLTQPVYHWWASLVHLGVFALKTYFLVFIMMWIRWTVPRFRVDQMMTLCWKKLIPIGMVCFTGVSAWTLLRPSFITWLGGNGKELYQSLVAAFGLLVSVLLIGGIGWFFMKPLTPEEQERRRLIARGNLSAGMGAG